MTPWDVLALAVGAALVLVATWTMTRRAYRHHRVVLAIAAVARAGGIGAVCISLLS